MAFTRTMVLACCLESLSSSEAKELLHEHLAGYITADDKLVREAIDRGVPTSDIKPRNGFVSELSKILGY